MKWSDLHALAQRATYPHAEARLQSQTPALTDILHRCTPERIVVEALWRHGVPLSPPQDMWRAIVREINTLTTNHPVRICAWCGAPISTPTRSWAGTLPGCTYPHCRRLNSIAASEKYKAKRKEGFTPFISLPKVLLPEIKTQPAKPLRPACIHCGKTLPKYKHKTCSYECMYAQTKARLAVERSPTEQREYWKKAKQKYRAKRKLNLAPRK